MDYSPCKWCGKEHLSDRCPRIVVYHVPMSPGSRSKMERGRLRAVSKSVSNRRLDKAFKEMRNE